MRLQPARFNALLNHMGQRVSWRPAMPCPCRDPHSGAARPGCPTCGGRGTFWRAGTEALVAPTAMKVAREWRDFGQYESGDVVLSIPSDSPAYAAAEHDQLVMLDSSAPHALTLTRGAADERVPPWTIGVEAAVALDQAGAATDLALPALPGLDGGAPTWPNGGGPASGQQYALRLRRRPTYYLFKEFPQDRAHHGGADLPRRVVARLFDLFGR